MTRYELWQLTEVRVGKKTYVWQRQLPQALILAISLVDRNCPALKKLSMWQSPGKWLEIVVSLIKLSR